MQSLFFADFFYKQKMTPRLTVLYSINQIYSCPKFSRQCYITTLHSREYGIYW